MNESNTRTVHRNFRNGWEPSIKQWLIDGKPTAELD
jgi:hypothetical protein